jgi:hypothetical protein
VAIRKLVLQVSLLFDDEAHCAREWSLSTVARQIDEGDCIGTVEEVFVSEPLSKDEIVDTEIAWGGDGTFMLAGDTE